MTEEELRERVARSVSPETFRRLEESEARVARLELQLRDVSVAIASFLSTEAPKVEATARAVRELHSAFMSMEETLRG